MPVWQVFKGKYQGFPEYTTRITGHYAGDMLLLEEVGVLSHKCAESLFGGTKLMPNTLYEMSKPMIEKALNMDECQADSGLLRELLEAASSGLTIMVRLKTT